MKDTFLPFELANLFWTDYKGKYYKGWWEILDYETNICDQYDNIPHLHNDSLTIILHPTQRNSNTIYHFFKIENNEVKLTVYGTRFNGLDIEYSEPPYCKGKIYKVKKWLEELIKEN